MKTCTQCKIEQAEEDFYVDKYATSGRRPICRLCCLAYQQKHKDKDPEGFYKKWKHNRVRRDYNLSPEEYETFLTEQDNKCQICETREPPLAIDHCHDTGKVRGLLCRKCNLGLGMFKDDFKLVSKAASYLDNIN